MVRQFHKLPSLILLDVFYQVPLNQLGRLRKVCVRFKMLLPRVFAYRRRLILLISPRGARGFHDVPIRDWRPKWLFPGEDAPIEDDLDLLELTLGWGDELPEWFYNLNTSMCHTRYLSIRLAAMEATNLLTGPLTRLILAWASKLHSLDIMCSWIRKVDCPTTLSNERFLQVMANVDQSWNGHGCLPQLGPLLNAIDSLPALKTLKLQFDANLRDSKLRLAVPINLQLQLTNLGKVHDFYISTLDDANLLQAIIADPKLLPARLYLDTTLRLNTAAFNALVAMPPEAAVKVAHLRMGELVPRIMAPTFEQLSHLRGLIRLDLSKAGNYNVLTDWPRLIAVLAPFGQLTHLHLKLHFDRRFIPPNRIDPDDEDEDHPDDPPPPIEHPWAQLASMRSLVLNAAVRDHTNLASLYLPEVMPGLETIRLQTCIYSQQLHSWCGPCEPMLSLLARLTGTARNQDRRCLRRLAEPLIECTNLRHISIRYKAPPSWTQGNGSHEQEYEPELTELSAEILAEIEQNRN